MTDPTAPTAEVLAAAQQLANTGSGPAAPPAWFDETKHKAGVGGIYEIATGVLLDGEDGLPQSGPLRAQRLAEAAAAVPARGRRATNNEAGE